MSSKFYQHQKDMLLEGMLLNIPNLILNIGPQRMISILLMMCMFHKEIHMAHNIWRVNLSHYRFMSSDKIFLDRKISMIGSEHNDSILCSYQHTYKTKHIVDYYTFSKIIH